MEKTITKKAVKKDFAQKSTFKNSPEDSLGNSFNNSWKAMWKNKNLFLPDIFNLIITWFFIILFLAINGMMNILDAIGMDRTESSTFIANSFKDVIANGHIGTLVLSSLIILVLIIFTSILFGCIKYLMIKQIIEKKTVSFKEASKYWKEYFWGFIGVNLLSILIVLGIVLGTAIVAVIIGTLGSLISEGLETGLVIIFMLGGFAAVIYFGLGLLYAKVIYFMEKPKATEAIKKSFKFFKENKKHVILVVLIMVGIGIGFGILTNILALVGALIGIVQSVWIGLFLFLTWKK